MDGLIKHWAGFSRKHPFPCTLAAMDYFENKDHWIEQSFLSCGFCFILRGNGEFHRSGHIHQIEAPCVVALWPGDSIAYGPFMPASGWDELHLIYSRDCLDYLMARGFFKEDRLSWPIHNIKSVRTMVAELTTLACAVNPADVADRVDSACDRLILESLSPAEGCDAMTKDILMEQIALYVNEKLACKHDFDRLAEEHGLSVSTFRRRWLQTFRTPPWRYLLNLRIQLACRLLAESSLPITKIAEMCGFDDALYFSRRFRLETKVSPSEYRMQLSRAGL